MTGADDSNGRTAHERAAGADPAEGADPASWLLRHKMGLSDAIEGYVERAELEGRCALPERRLTVLHAPGGAPFNTILVFAKSLTNTDKS